MAHNFRGLNAWLVGSNTEIAYQKGPMRESSSTHSRRERVQEEPSRVRVSDRLIPQRHNLSNPHPAGASSPDNTSSDAHQCTDLLMSIVPSMCCIHQLPPKSPSSELMTHLCDILGLNRNRKIHIMSF